jgi:hypothetical protein
MKAILSMALVLGACGLARAAEKVDPVGTWNSEYEIAGRKLTSTLVIKKDADKLAGTISWPDQKDAKLKDVKFKDGTLSFSVVREYMELKIPLEFELTIKGDKFEGKATSDFGGQKSEWDVVGKREKKDK